MNETSKIVSQNGSVTRNAFTYASATDTLHELSTETVARYRMADTQRTRNALAAALAEVRADAEAERAKWDSFASLLTSAR